MYILSKWTDHMKVKIKCLYNKHKKVRFILITTTKNITPYANLICSLENFNRFSRPRGTIVKRKRNMRTWNLVTLAGFVKAI